ncbi:MAG: sulfatase-like hydrolase/transferase [Acidobacteriota bacterium]
MSARVALAAAAIAIAASAARAADPGDTVLVVADSLRADALGAYGSAAMTSPHLDRLSRGATTFTAARAASSWTLPSMAAALSGRLPRRTGVQGQLDRVAPDLPLAAEILASRGYRTAAVSANYLYVSPKAGLGRGFDRFEVVTLDASGTPIVSSGIPPLEAFGARPATAPAGVLVPRVCAILRALPAPRFAYLHVMDTHFPYGNRLPAIDAVPGAPAKGRMAAIFVDGKTPTSSEAAYARALYVRAVRSLDHGLAALWRAPEIARSRVVFTSDHGEEFFDHGRVSHGHTLYEELLRVPLIVRDGSRSALDPRAISLASLAGYLVDGAWRSEIRVIAERDNQGSERAIVAGRYKLIEGTAGACLYDLASDPGETYDAGPVPADLLEALSAGSGDAARPGGQIPVTEEELRSLGYLH